MIWLILSWFCRATPSYESLATPCMALFGPHQVKEPSKHCAQRFSKICSPDRWRRRRKEWKGFRIDREIAGRCVIQQVARQRAFLSTPDLPPVQRRLDRVCTPGYTGCKRGEIIRPRMTVLQAHTHWWLDPFSEASSASNGE